MWASPLAPWLAVLAVLVSLVSLASPVLADGAARLAVATEDRHVSVIDLSTGATVWREPSTGPIEWPCVFLRQLASGSIVIGYEHDDPMVSAGRWFQETRDPLTGVLITSFERTDGPLPRHLAPDPSGNWVFGSAKHVIDKPAQGGAYNSWGVAAWNRNTGALRHGAPLYKCLIRHWRRSAAMDGLISVTHEQADAAITGPWWVNLALEPAGETSQWQSPLASDGAFMGEWSPAFFVEEVETPRSPTGFAWIIGGEWGWKAVRVDTAQQVPSYPDIIPVASSIGFDYRGSLKVGSRVIVAERVSSGFVAAHSIDIATLTEEWESDPFPSAEWTCQALARAGSCVVLATLADEEDPPGLRLLNPSCGEETSFVELPSDPRFMAAID